MIDHIDGNRTNNRIENLREANGTQNSLNRRPYRKNGTKGFWKSKNGKSCYAQISYKGKVYRLGSFKTEKEAMLAYNKKALELHGEFARINKIED